MRERCKALEAELHKLEHHKDLRGQYLKNLEELVSIDKFLVLAKSETAESVDQNEKLQTAPYFNAAAKAVASLASLKKTLRTNLEASNSSTAPPVR